MKFLTSIDPAVACNRQLLSSSTMSIPLFNAGFNATQPLPLHRPQCGGSQYSVSLFNGKYRFENEGLRRTNAPVLPCRVQSKTSESLSSVNTELEKEREREMERDREEGDERTVQSPRSFNEVNWREIHGENDWRGLLDPLNPLLRSELIRYGEMAQACYDAFDYDSFSKCCGSCKYPRRKFFENLGMSDRGYDYEVTRYLYATSNVNLPNFFKKSRWSEAWSRRANWIGYIAVSNDETSKRIGRRDITIAWRGTVTKLEWISDLMDFLRPISYKKNHCSNQGIKVESGFVDLYTEKDENCRFCKSSAREQILKEITKVIEAYGNEDLSITITGHSLGSALAILSAYDIAETGLNVTPDGHAVPIAVFSFSGPRVGNLKFKERVESLGVKVLRVVNVHDMVPKMPGLVLNEHSPVMLMKMAWSLPWCYSHVGVRLELDHKTSPFLKSTNDPINAHNLEAHLHLLDGYQGKGERFALTSGRDIALVNKASDFLNDHHNVPPHWRQDENKGLVKYDGRWIQPDRSNTDDHPTSPG